jgi:DNA-3-methyladenine glycosylase
LARLGRSFYSRYTPDVARDLIGATLVRKVDGKVLTGRIVEVEAYRGADDPASHAYRGLTRRTAVMFGKAGRAYVYLAYGVNYCLNLTTEAEGEPGAVLIRAVEPIEGVEEMLLRRGVQDVTRVARGPGNLTRALGIDLQLKGLGDLAGAVPARREARGGHQRLNPHRGWFRTRDDVEVLRRSESVRLW